MTDEKFIGRDQNIHVGNRGVYIGGDAKNNVIQTGDGNILSRGDVQQYFQPIYEKIAASALSEEDKKDLTVEVEAIEAEVVKGNDADESALARHLRSIRRIAPDILDVALAALQGPVAAFSAVASKVAQKMKETA